MEEKICMLLEEWESQKQSETSSSCRRSQRHLDCDHEERHKRLFNDYFTDELVYLDSIFNFAKDFECARCCF